MIELVPLESMGTAELDGIGNRLHSMLGSSPETRYHLNVRGLGYVVARHTVSAEQSRRSMHRLRETAADMELGAHIVRRRLPPVGEIQCSRLLGLIEPTTENLTFHDPRLGRIPLMGAAMARMRAVEPPVEGFGVAVWLKRQPGWRFDMEGALRALTKQPPDGMHIWTAEPQTALNYEPDLHDSYAEAGFNESDEQHFIRRGPDEPVLLSTVFDYKL